MIFKREEEATAEGISGRPPPTQKMPKYQGGSKRRVKGQQVWSLTQFSSVSFFSIMDNQKCVNTNSQSFFFITANKKKKCLGLLLNELMGVA